MGEKRYRIQTECPECGCGLIEKMAPDVWREKYGETKRQQVEVACPKCGQKHLATVHEEEV